MSQINKILMLLIIVVVAVLLGNSRFLEIGAVRPNWILIAFLITSFCFPGGRSRIFTLFIMTALLFLSSFWLAFWVWEVAFLGAIVFGVSFLRPFLFNTDFIDFSIIAVSATLIFYIGLGIINAFTMPWFVVGGEAFYNALLGGLLLFTIKRITIL